MALLTKKRGKFFFSLFLWLLACALHGGVILENEGIISEKTSQKIEQIGAELKSKTDVSLYLAAKTTLGGKKISQYEEEVAKTLNPPFILLSFVLNDHQIDIISSEDLNGSFDKEAVLSPYTWTGTIIPILISKSEDKYNAALLNGYADIAEQVVKSRGKTLESGLGSESQTFIRIIKLLVYGIIGLALIYYLYYRIRRTYAKG